MNLIKNAIKLALAGAALVGGVAHAGITNLPGQTGTFPDKGSDLVLFAWDSDTTHPTDSYFYVDLGVQIGNLVNLDGITAATPAATVTPFNVTGTSTTAIDSFVSWASSANRGDSSGIKWSIMASERNGTNTGLAVQDVAFTAPTSVNYGTSVAALANSQIGGVAAHMQSLFSYMDGSVPGGVSDTEGWNATGLNSDGKDADVLWNLNQTTGASLGEAMNLWAFAMNGTGTTKGNKYLGATMTLSLAGLKIQNPISSEVPLPAAAWLFGSGLLGLAGVGRRKKVAVAA